MARHRYRKSRPKPYDPVERLENRRLLSVSFASAVDYPNPSYAVFLVPTSVAVADVTGDGKADLIVPLSSTLHTVDVLPGNGNGTFGSPQSHDSGVGFSNAVA